MLNRVLRNLILVLSCCFIVNATYTGSSFERYSFELLVTGEKPIEVFADGFCERTDQDLKEPTRIGICGVFKNVSKTPKRNIKAVVEFYNAKGELVITMEGADRSYPMLEPGEFTWFDTTVNGKYVKLDKSATSYKIKDITYE